MRALVTGGAGFIGSHLCDALLERGYEVVALDNFLTGRRRNLAHLAHHPRFALIEHDVIYPLDLSPPPSVVFHLASPASPVGYKRYPVETMLVNAQGTRWLLERARESGAIFVLASTSEVYGNPRAHPQREDYWGNVNPVGPRACYDEAKRFAEALTMVYGHRYGVDGRIVRIFNCYGPRSDPQDGRMVPNFVTQALRGQPITVYGDGSQTRSLCYIDDLVQGLLAVASSPQARGEVINLGSPEEHSVLTYAKIIRRLAPSQAPIIHVQAREEEIAQRCPDITKAKALLGWEPHVGLTEGLDRTIAWFRQELALLVDAPAHDSPEVP